MCTRAAFWAAPSEKTGQEWMWRTEPWQTQPSAITVTLSFSFNPLGIVAARSENLLQMHHYNCLRRKPLQQSSFLTLHYYRQYSKSCSQRFPAKVFHFGQV